MKCSYCIKDYLYTYSFYISESRGVICKKYYKYKFKNCVKATMEEKTNSIKRRKRRK